MADDALTRKEAEMGRLTRKEIEYLVGQFALLAARAEWKPKSIDRIRTFGDLALRALSLESVREEALATSEKAVADETIWLDEGRAGGLEEAAKLCETQAPFLPSLAIALRYRARPAAPESDTPETEAKIVSWHSDPVDEQRDKAEDFARSLERRLAQAQARVAELERDLGLERESHDVTKRMLEDQEHRVAELEKDAARLDALEREVLDSPLLLHNGVLTKGFRGLGLANTGRTLRKAIDDMTYANQLALKDRA